MKYHVATIYSPLLHWAHHSRLGMSIVTIGSSWQPLDDNGFHGAHHSHPGTHQINTKLAMHAILDSLTTTLDSPWLTLDDYHNLGLTKTIIGYHTHPKISTTDGLTISILV